MARSFGRVESRGEVQIKKGGGTMFLRLTQGDNPVRFFGDTYRTWIHWFTDAEGNRKRVNCAGDGCPLCRSATKPEEEAKPRFYNTVIDRKDANNPVVKVIDMGTQIFGQIQQLDEDDDWGSVEEYDINIKRGPKGSNPLYNATPKKPAELTNKDKALIKAAGENIDLAKLTAPSTIKAIEAILSGKAVADSFADEDDDSPPAKSSAPAQKKEKKEAATDKDVDDFFDV